MISLTFRHVPIPHPSRTPLTQQASPNLHVSTTSAPTKPMGHDRSARGLSARQPEDEFDLDENYEHLPDRGDGLKTNNPRNRKLIICSIARL